MKKSAILATLAFASLGHAYEAKITRGQLPPTLHAMIEKANADTKLDYKLENFILIEKRELATSNFQMYAQTNSMVPVAQTAIRIWSDKKTGDLILAEMHLNEAAKLYEDILGAKYVKAKFSPAAIKSMQLSNSIQEVVTAEISKHSTDPRILGMKFKDEWQGQDLVRVVEVRARRGVHIIEISLLQNKVINSFYREFSQGETVRAHVFPIYEEVEATGQKLSYEERDLKFLDAQIPNGGETPLSSLGNETFPENKYNPLFAETDMGRLMGYWSETTLRAKVEGVISKLPVRANDFASGLLLSGKFATINLHPGVKEAFPGIDFPLKASVHPIISWAANPKGEFIAKPLTGFLGKPVGSESDLMARLPERLADHNPTKYINNGFDQIQVYYGVTTLMEALNEMGFTDPEYGTKAFNAFLYDPDISMKNNAYYYDNAINFTTYTPENPNLARDNPTVWHELGHGVMERLMGVNLGFADSKGGYGGLSEGMADFVASIIVQYQTMGTSFPGDQDFRIINQTGFYLTNEFHDEGEAYGGVMHDMLMTVVKAEGKQGLTRFTDLTLETMRLTRNHPALSARSWFEHLVYADDLGSEVRSAGQYNAIIKAALAKRNFAFSSSFHPASLKVTFKDTELTNDSPASREKPLAACDPSGVVSYDLKVALASGDAQFIKFPAVVKVEYKKGALQGAIKWEGKQNNPTVYSIASSADVLNIPLKASMKCDSINQPDGSCKDYAYIQVFNQGDSKPIAKKRFYLKIKDGSTCTL
jgi:hypothetical protein